MDENTPQFNGSFLFILDLSLTFKACGNARRSNNYQELLRNLEIAALGLSSYYDSDEGELEIEKRIFDLRRELNLVLIVYEETEALEISETFAIDIYHLERDLRHIWKKSGLQMALRNAEESEDF